MFTFGDVELTKEEFDKMMENSEELDVEIKVKQKKEPMEKLNYRFNKGVQRECESLADMFECHNQSDVARAAIAIGLAKLRSLAKEETRKANGMVHLGKIRHDFLK